MPEAALLDDPFADLIAALPAAQIADPFADLVAALPKRSDESYEGQLQNLGITPAAAQLAQEDADRIADLFAKSEEQPDKTQRVLTRLDLARGQAGGELLKQAGQLIANPPTLVDVADLFPPLKRARQEIGRSIADEGERRSREFYELGQEVGGGKIGDVAQSLATTGIQSLPVMLGAPAGIAGLASAAGAQSYAATLADASSRYAQEGQSREEAEQRSKLPALINGVVTGGLTRYMPGGAEALIQGLATGQVSKEAGSGLVKAIIKESITEFPEEALDQLSQGIVAKLSYDPQKTGQQIVEEAVLAGLAGSALAGVAGGVRGAAESTARRVKDLRRETPRSRLVAEPTPEIPVEPEFVALQRNIEEQQRNQNAIQVGEAAPLPVETRAEASPQVEPQVRQQAEAVKVQEAQPEAQRPVAPVEFIGDQEGMPALKWYRLTEPITTPSGQTYKAGTSISNGELTRFGYSLPPATAVAPVAPTPTAPATEAAAPQTKVVQIPEPEFFASIEDVLSFRKTRLREEQRLLEEQIGLTPEEAIRLQRLFAADSSTERFEKTLTPEKRARLEAFLDGPLNQKSSPFKTWDTDTRLNPESIAEETDPELLSSALVSAIQRGVEESPNSDRFISAVIAAKRLLDLGFSKSDLARYLDSYTTRNSSSQGDKTELFKSLGAKVNAFLARHGIDLPIGSVGTTQKGGETVTREVEPTPKRTVASETTGATSRLTIPAINVGTRGTRDLSALRVPLPRDVLLVDSKGDSPDPSAVRLTYRTSGKGAGLRLYVDNKPAYLIDLPKGSFESTPTGIAVDQTALLDTSNWKPVNRKDPNRSPFTLERDQKARPIAQRRAAASDKPVSTVKGAPVARGFEFDEARIADAVESHNNPSVLPEHMRDLLDKSPALVEAFNNGNLAPVVAAFEEQIRRKGGAEAFRKRLEKLGYGEGQLPARQMAEDMVNQLKADEPMLMVPPGGRLVPTRVVSSGTGKAEITGLLSQLDPAASSLATSLIDLLPQQYLDGLTLNIVERQPAEGSQVTHGGSFSALLNTASILRDATNPDVAIHEISHWLESFLNSDERTQNNNLWRQELDREIANSTGERRDLLQAIKDANGLTSMEYLAQSGGDTSAYYLTNPSEFFAHRFTDQSRAELKRDSALDYIRGLLRSIVEAVKRLFGRGDFYDGILRKFTAGDFQVDARTGPLFERNKYGVAASLEPSVPTQYMGMNWLTLGRITEMTPEVIQNSINVAKGILDQAGFVSELKTYVDPQGRELPIFRMVSASGDVNQAGQALAELVRREVATQREPGKDPYRLGMILNSVTENYRDPASIVSTMNRNVRSQLFRVADTERSWRGGALGALAQFKMDLPAIGQNVDVYLDELYYDQHGGIAVDELIAKVRQKAEKQPNTREGRRKALQEARGELTEPQINSLKANKPVWKIIESLVAQGKMDTGEYMRQIATSRGMKAVTDEEVAKMRALSAEIRRLSTLTKEEIAAAGGDELKLRKATTDRLALWQERIYALTKELNARWKRLTEPINNPLTHPRQWWDTRKSTAAAVNEYIAANLLFKVGVAGRQATQILSQLPVHRMTRAIGHALDMNRIAINRGQTSTFWKDAGGAISDAYRNPLVSMKHSLAEAKAAFKGSSNARNVDAIMSGVSAFERSELRAKELTVQAKESTEKGDYVSASRDYAYAALHKLFGVLRLGYRVLQTSDAFQGTLAEYQELNRQITQGLREQGRSPLEIKLAKDSIAATVNSEFPRALAYAKAAFAADGLSDTDPNIRRAAWNLVRAWQFQKIAELGLPADDFKKINDAYREVLGWNRVETRGPGGLVAFAGKSVQQMGVEMGIPLPLGAFANAIGTNINRILHFTPAYALANVNFLGKKGQEVSPWFETETDIRQRRTEAAAGSLVGFLFCTLAAMGVIRVFLRPPPDKEERDLWEREGHRAGTVEILHDDGKFSAFSLTTSPFALVAPHLAAGGALNNLFKKREEAQAKLNEKAARLGLPPGKVKPISAGEMLGVGMAAAQGAILGGRTAAGLLYSISDFGTPNVEKFAASQIGPYVPGLPALQEFSRMAGVSLDSKMASVWDFLLPLPTSPARRVNLLGEPTETVDDLQRITQILTGGNYIGIDPAQAKQQAAYTALFASGYRPPSIDPNKGQPFPDSYRPMTAPELHRYTVARGKHFSRELSLLGPDPTEESAKAAYTRANADALREIGVNVPRPRRRTTRSRRRGFSVRSRSRRFRIRGLGRRSRRLVRV